jgi:hypothetical protein
VKLLQNDSAWVELATMNSENNREQLLQKFSPEWNTIQSQIEQKVAGINDAGLRQSERTRLQESLLPDATENQLYDSAFDKLRQQQADYLRTHADEFSIIATFTGQTGGYLYASVREIKPNDIYDDTLFGEPVSGESPKSFLRLTVRELDTALTKFRALNGGDSGREADMVIAGLLERGKHGHDIVGKTSPIYLVDKMTGTILAEVPREAFCFENAVGLDFTCEKTREK